MPFVQVDINEVISNKKTNDVKFQKLWNDSREEYRLIGEMIALRKAEKITQKELANRVGSRQQVISRIEKKENAPSLKCFCNILNALGYELQIVRKNR